MQEWEGEDRAKPIHRPRDSRCPMPKCQTTLEGKQTSEEECQTSKFLGISVEIKEGKVILGEKCPTQRRTLQCKAWRQV